MNTTPDYNIRAASSEQDLRGILSLQSLNMKDDFSPAERRQQGFLTLKHDFDLLRDMNKPWPHVIATPRGSDEVVAYALTMTREFRRRVPLLEPLFDHLDLLEYRGRPVNDYRFYVMGQVCVARAHRGRGLVEGLYQGHRRQMSPHFDLLITDIDRANPRSMRAHEKAGFAYLHEYRIDSGDEWVIVLIDLRPGS